MTKKENKKYKVQIATLIKVNQTHIQQQENEILKLMTKKTKESEIQILAKEKANFKENYFKTLPSKFFSAQQVNFFRNCLEKYDFQMSNLLVQKQKIQSEIDELLTEVKEHRDKLKKYSFKNEKYDYLKLSYG